MTSPPPPTSLITLSHLARLPDELLESIVYHLPPVDTINFGLTSKQANKITYEPLVWRRHCLHQYRYWEPRHEIQEKLLLPPAQTKWRHLFNQRRLIDKEALELFEQLLLTQQYRIERMEKVATYGYDVNDLLLKLRDETSDDAPDTLARRYHAKTILGQIHRATALEKWMRLQQKQMVRLEEVLGAYDLFVFSGTKGDLNDIGQELDRLAARIRARDPDFDGYSIRKKAMQIARYLRAENLVGNPDETDYHALRNNFISLALFEEPHHSLPLQSVAIYCAVARRLGVNARPSNYPHHVHAVIDAPVDETLDGAPRTPSANPEPSEAEVESEQMHMDPWRSSTEVPRVQLTTRLTLMGAPPAQHAAHLGATSTLEMALRTGRNIMNSVQQARDRQRGAMRRMPSIPDVEAAWYSMLWSMLILDENPGSAASLHRRRQCLPYLIEHHQAHFPEDLGLIERLIAPMFTAEREHDVLLHLITSARKGDSMRRAPSHRPKKAELRAWMIPGEGGVAFKIGTWFRHKRYGYQGIVVGWDVQCQAEQRWVEQMRVDELPRGREQPFYNVVADDKSIRYVAEENLQALGGPADLDDANKEAEQPAETLMALAGRYFKRWDAAEGKFVSNIRDEYPDD